MLRQLYRRNHKNTGGLVTLCKLLRWRHPMYKTYTEVQIIDSKFKTIQTIVRNASNIVITTKTCTSAKRGPSPRVVPLLSPLPAGAHLYGGEELQVIVPNIPFVCPVSVCSSELMSKCVRTEYAGNIQCHKSSKTWKVLFRAYKLPLSCPAHLPLLTACHCLAKVSFTPTWLFFLAN